MFAFEVRLSEHIFIIASLTETPELIDSCFDFFPNPLRTYAKIFLSFQKPYSQLPISFLFFEQMSYQCMTRKMLYALFNKRFFLTKWELFSNKDD